MHMQYICMFIYISAIEIDRYTYICIIYMHTIHLYTNLYKQDWFVCSSQSWIWHKFGQDLYSTYALASCFFCSLRKGKQYKLRLYL